MAKLNLQSAIHKNVKTTLSNAFSSTEHIKQQIAILDELRGWIPAPTPDEYKQLELNIAANGCRDSLILWETTQQQVYPDSPNPNHSLYVLVDGHNRYQICKSRNISFNIQLMDFTDLKSVKDFMIDLQLGRRNLTPQQITYFRGLRYLNEKTEKGKYDRRSEFNKVDESLQSKVANKTITSEKVESTAEKLAIEYNVGRNTILRDAEYAAGVEQLTPELKQSILTGLVKVEKAQLQKLSKIQLDQPIHSIDALKQIVVGSEKSSSVLPDKKQLREKTESELNELMRELIQEKVLTRKRIEQLIEKASQLKTVI
ncbi:hypothetical protein M0L20_25775 [Spirosoma sp. RP8]|uniref:ParB N-terminal domain-containing protein n=1 Tax=Spirosoma liriopis TaxID=2937440 RepID=A0ABT0HT03_9BACT|nr:hypothetical protein [Spirosoma liriopis]MCK8495301.1 hypothetical protein [Spirosoma liriopis]